MSPLDFGPTLFSQGALACYVLGLLMRDGLKLRLFLLAGTGCYLIYYYTVADHPLWDAIFASTIIGAANLYAIVTILIERTSFMMSQDDRALYAHFPTMTPGQFRRIMRVSNRVQADAPHTLTREGEPPAALYFVTKGPITLVKQNKAVAINDGQFIGEISFIIGNDAPASATVIVDNGAQFISWDRAELYKALDKSRPLANAFSALFNKDLSYKVASSWPALR